LILTGAGGAVTALVGAAAHVGEMPTTIKQTTRMIRTVPPLYRPEQTKRPDLTDKRTNLERVGAILPAGQRVAPF
jgi:hypothetical protein